MFVAHLKQCGEGCDYTIACGEELIELEAETWEQARAEVRRVLEEVHTHGSESRLEEVTIYQVAKAFQVPVDEWYGEIRADEEDAQAARDKDKRRRDYERLKREFGND